jgi:predicted acetyltransferase
MSLVLRELGVGDEAAFTAGMADWNGESPSWYSFAWQPGMAFSEMLGMLRKESAGIDLVADRVPHSMLYGFVNGEIIGRVSIRHRLNARLEKRGVCSRC